jgi:hypothetical protein
LRTFSEWSDDIKTLAIIARRATFASSQMPEKEAEKALDELNIESKKFADKYAMSEDDAREIAISISENCKLGLAY